jgi:hypothetical protein
MKTNITKKQLYTLIDLAHYLQKISTWNEEGECYPNIDHPELMDKAMELHGLAYDLTPIDDEEKENTEPAQG